MHAAGVDQQIAGDDGKTAKSRRLWTEPRIQSSHSVRGSNWKLSALQLAGGDRNRVEGQPRSWGIDRDSCAFFAQADRRNDNHARDRRIAATTFAQGVTVEAEATSSRRRKSPGKQIVQGQSSEPEAARAVA